MAYRRPPDRAASLDAVTEVGEAEIRALSEAGLRSDPAHFSEEAIQQLTAQKGVVAAAGARFFAVVLDGTIAAGCDLYSDAGVAQIEAVTTLAAFRNRGLARAVVLRALAAARETGAELVFLQAEYDDWPKELYRKLGFDAMGALHVFVRPPP
jgi:GNAT superfamily N-acetyltransferase